MARSKSLSEQALFVLASLMSGPKHGYAILTDVELHTGKRLGPGTLYGIIARLEKMRLIEPLEAEDRGRRPYCATGTGRRVFSEHMRALEGRQRALESIARG